MILRHLAVLCDLPRLERLTVELVGEPIARDSTRPRR
jgi:hypothetical protein